MSDVMMLAKGYDAKKVKFPVYVSEKLDGVAARLTAMPDGSVTVVSRQDKPLPSLVSLLEALRGHLRVGTHLFVELTIPGLDFKDASGIIRRKQDAPGIVANLYDVLHPELIGHPFESRLQAMQQLRGGPRLNLIEHVKCQTQEDLDKAVAEIYKRNPKSEGAMVRQSRGIESQYKFGRSWGMMKLKKKPTVDLRVVGLHQAVSKTGELLGMVGRIDCEYKDKIIGVGPGKMTHDERRKLWNEWREQPLIIEVEYMEDDSYDALRQPTFQRIRDDKEEPSYE